MQVRHFETFVCPGVHAPRRPPPETGREIAWPRRRLGSLTMTSAGVSPPERPSSCG